MIKRNSWLVIVLLLFVACQPNKQKNEVQENRPILMVTIEPLRYFTEAIAGPRFTVESIVPRGSSPETYDPTPAQLLALADSRAYLRIGSIGFEQVWMDRLMANAPNLPVFNTSQGIDFILEDEGPEPHVWTSTVNARIIADNIATALCALDSTHTAEYLHRRDSLMAGRSLPRPTVSAVPCCCVPMPTALSSFTIRHSAILPATTVCANSPSRKPAKNPPPHD